MKILVINTGSSSIKYELFHMDSSMTMAGGIAEKIGEKSGKLTHFRMIPGKGAEKRTEETFIPDHRAGMRRIAELLTHREHGVIEKASDISAVGHRVVHGGEAFKATTIIDDNIINTIRENARLAPLHNPANLIGIEVTKEIFPNAIQVAVFDTAFHQTIPRKAFLYAIPLYLYEEEKIRRYGFHGTSHAYVSEMAAKFMQRPLDQLNMITIHLGNGASMAAIKNGKCVDTSMGLTPLEGLVMGTRSGDVDPALPFFLADHMNMPFKEIDRLLNEQSGLKGLCGTNDMREVIEKKDRGDKKAALALDIFCYRIKKYIGAYIAVLGSLDALVFTAGIGENSPEVRELCCSGLENLGISIDERKNRAQENGTRDISKTNGRVRVMVVPTNEELRIALETQKVIETR